MTEKHESDKRPLLVGKPPAPPGECVVAMEDIQASVREEQARTNLLNPVGFRDEAAISDMLVLLTDLMSVEMGNGDLEAAHRNADGILIDALRALGQFAGRSTYTDRLIRYYERVKKRCA